MNMDLGVAGTWEDLGYVDTGWPQGPALLDGKLDTVATTTNRTPNLRTTVSGIPVGTFLVVTNAGDPTTVNDIPTFYFRGHFTLPTDPAAVTRLLLRPVVDDYFVLYLNGQEVYRTNLTDAELAFASFLPTATAVGDANYEGPFSLPTANLVQGDNLLAAEVKQQAAGSSDITFGLELVAEISGCGPGLHIARTAGHATLTWSDPSYSLEQASSVLGPWSALTGSSGLSVTTTTGTKFYRLKK